MKFLEKTEKTPSGGTVTISYSILGIGLIVLICLVSILGVVDNYSEWSIELKDYISICTFGCVTIGLIYNAVGLQYNYRLNKEKAFKEDKIQNERKIQITYEAITEWYKKDMAENSERTRALLSPFKNKMNDPNVLTQFKAYLEHPEQITARQCFTSVLNYFEHLSLLCNDSVIDELTLKKAFRTAFITYYNTLKEYIDDERRGNNGNNHKIYINFVEVATRWLNT